MTAPAVKRVMASGVFDVIHPGHLDYLHRAKAHGDQLVVVVASDGHIRHTKRTPHHSQTDRAQLVRSLALVDDVIIGADPFDLVATVRAANPDVIALGYDQPFQAEQLASELQAADITVTVVRIPHYPNAESTHQLLGKL